MSLITPGRITKVHMDGALPTGRVDFGGVSKEVCLGYVPNAQVGQYVLVHAGFAISVLDERGARAQLNSIDELASLNDEI